MTNDAQGLPQVKVEPVIWNSKSALPVNVRLEHQAGSWEARLRLEATEDYEVSSGTAIRMYSQDDQETGKVFRVRIRKLTERTRGDQFKLGHIKLSFRLLTIKADGKRDNPNSQLPIPLEVISPYACSLFDPKTSHAIGSKECSELLIQDDRLRKVTRGRTLRKIWNKIKGADKSAIWLHGVPQCGKTMLLMDLAEYIKKREPSWIAVHVHVKRRESTRLWELMLEIDEVLCKVMRESVVVRQPEHDSYFNDPYLTWSNVIHGEVDRYLESHNQTLLLMWDGFYHQDNLDIYQALVGLTSRAGEGNLKRCKLLVTDVVSFAERLARSPGQTPSLLERHIEHDIVENVPMTHFTLSETTRLLRLPFGCRFPACELSETRRKGLWKMTCGHPAILKSVLHQTDWLYEEGSTEADFAVPEDAVRKLWEQYKHLKVLSPEEEECFRVLSGNPEDITLNDVAWKTGVGLETLTETIELLESKGLVDRIAGRPPRFRTKWPIAG